MKGNLSLVRPNAFYPAYFQPRFIGTISPRAHCPSPASSEGCHSVHKSDVAPHNDTEAKTRLWRQLHQLGGKLALRGYKYEGRILSDIAQKLVRPTTKIRFKTPTPEHIATTLVNIMWLVDPVTAQHSQRVQALSRHMSDNSVLSYAALLHDIGKIGLDDHALQDTRRFKLKERNPLFREHPVFTRMILDAVGFDGNLVKVSEIAAAHHERHDGAGYPCKLEGTQIPKYTQELTVIDFIDACSSHRPYRDRMPFNQLMSELKRNAGSHFSPQAVQRFLQMPAKGFARILCQDNIIRKTYAEIERLLAPIPEDLTLQELIRLKQSTGISRSQRAMVKAFGQVYCLAPISRKA